MLHNRRTDFTPEKHNNRATGIKTLTATTHDQLRTTGRPPICENTGLGKRATPGAPIANTRRLTITTTATTAVTQPSLLEMNAHQVGHQPNIDPQPQRREPP